ncbi:mechanosensitive ion channel family protein [Halobellus sp. H-GB7]|uniref:mechanosensitive ion channel family protein n=1 Tax=Halobellus sp. H-GB7 TaxID=3069756 RepID=UPI0027B19FD2|nr:mechanosensitive ion channel family protein [Halobellus sp. H-GB7]MDQ2055036.1 mechanosensitive ion channel family protein [Halobellus sp. H-GB7]
MSHVGPLLALQIFSDGVGSTLAGLPQLVPSTAGRIAVTFAIGVAVMALLARTEWLHAIEPEQIPQTLWHVFVTFGTMILALTGGVAIVAVWGLSAELLGVFGDNYGPETLVRIGISLLFLIGAYTMTGLVRQLIEEIAETRSSLGEHEREIAFRIGQVTLYLLAFTIVLSLWRVNVGGILVGAGFLGIVVGMAARQTLGALIAGFVLMFSRPFEIGDWIQVGEHEGIVTDITIVNTRIQTFDGEYVMIPNDVVSSESLVNRSRKGRLRIEVEVGVDYDADPERAAKVAQKAVSRLDDPMSVPTPQVVLKRLGDSAVVLGVRYWIDNPSARRKWRSQTAVIGAVKEALEAEGIKIPFPQRELTGREEAGGFVLAGDDTGAEAASSEEQAPPAEAASDGGESS